MMGLAIFLAVDAIAKAIAFQEEQVFTSTLSSHVTTSTFGRQRKWRLEMKRMRACFPTQRRAMLETVA